ncbi:TBC1 domain family member 20 [Frankliniella fusca]|uniref:TBC1 domain family member 20 n=1 Tax=Frankliniella fusca TaxID=407009 RepID=A0AAE1LJM7_9NEOP|nr:TBC1 domain family member 20 [Frankliniella fusca]
MEPDLCKEKEGTLNDTGQSTADVTQTPLGQLSAAAINDQYGQTTDSISLDDKSLEDESQLMRRMSLSHREENGPLSIEDVSGSGRSENISPISGGLEHFDVVLEKKGAGDGFKEYVIDSDVNPMGKPDNKDGEPDDDMDPLITVDDSESQSSDLINFDTVSYDVMQRAEDDDEKSIATMSSLSCDIKMDSPSKLSQGSNSSSLINLIDTSIKEVSAAQVSSSSQMFVDALDSSASSCPSSPLHPPSLTMPSALEESGSETSVNSKDANAYIISIKNATEVSTYAQPSLEDSISLLTEDECRRQELSSKCQQGEIISAAPLELLNSKPNDIADDECNDTNQPSAGAMGSQEITPSEICKSDILIDNAIDDCCNTLVSIPEQEKVSLETLTLKKNIMQDSQLSMDSIVSTTLANSSLPDDVILQASSTSHVLPSNGSPSQITKSEGAPTILLTSDIPAVDHSENPEITTEASDQNFESSSVEEVSSLSSALFCNSEDVENLPMNSETKISISIGSQASVDSKPVYCDSSCEGTVQRKGDDLSSPTLSPSFQKKDCIKESPSNQTQLEDDSKKHGDLTADKQRASFFDESTCLSVIKDEMKRDLKPDTSLSSNHTKEIIECSGPSCEENMEDLNLSKAIGTYPSSQSLEAVHLDQVNSSDHLKRPTSLPNLGSNDSQAKQSQSMTFTDFINHVTEASSGEVNSQQCSASLLEAQQIASSLVHDILGTAILKAEETLISSANSASNRVEVVAAAQALIDEVLNEAIAQVYCPHSSSNEELDYSHVKENTRDTLTESLTLPESVLETTDKRLNSPSLFSLSEDVGSVNPTPLSTGRVEAQIPIPEDKGHAEKDPALIESPLEMNLKSTYSVAENPREEEEGRGMPSVLVVDKSTSSRDEIISTLQIDVICECKDVEDPSVSELSQEVSLILENSTLDSKPGNPINITRETTESKNLVDDCHADGGGVVCLNGCVSSTSDHSGDDCRLVPDFTCREVLSSCSETGSEVDLKISDNYSSRNASGEMSKTNSVADLEALERSERNSSSENGATDSAHSNLLTCSDLGLRSEASIFVDGVLEEAVKKYEESSSSEASPVKLKGLLLDSDFLQEDEELATPCGEMLTEHFMDFESGRNVSVFCSIPDNPSDDHLLAYDRIAHTIGNREVDSDTGKSVSVFRIEDDVYYEIQRTSTCTSVFESVEEEDEDMVDTTVPVEERPNRTMRTSASFPSFDRDKLDFSDDPLKADSDAFEDAVGAFLAKERLARDERKFLLTKNTKDAGVGNNDVEENRCRALVLRHPEYDLSNQEEKKKMAEKWANGDTPEMREKQRLIRQALESDEDVAVKLCKLALTEGGLINDSLRREAWPRMLGLDPTLEVDAPSLEDLKSHPEYGQVVLDVNRSLKRFPPDIPKDQRETLQDKLTRLIMYVISKHPHLRYYQGYHDVAVTFLLVVGESVAFQIMERLSTEHLSDCMQPTMERTSYLLHFIYPLLHRLHPTLADYLERSEVGTMFCLPWFLTWFGHSLDRYQDVVRLYDHFLASPPLAPLYVAAVLVAHRADEVLAVDCDMAAIHALLSHIPDSLPLEILLRDATELYLKFPPESIEREVEERFKNEQELRVHEMEARERVRQRALRRRRGHSHGSWQLAEVNNRFGGTMMTLNRWMPPWVVQQQRLSMRLLFASATFFVGFYVYSRGGDMLPYIYTK